MKRLDPARLRGIRVASIGRFKKYPTKQLLKNGLLAELGVKEEGETTFTVAGLGPDHGFRATLERIGKNWFVSSVEEQ